MSKDKYTRHIFAVLKIGEYHSLAKLLSNSLVSDSLLLDCLLSDSSINQ